MEKINGENIVENVFELMFIFQATNLNNQTKK